MNKLDLFRFGNTRKKKIRLYVIITSCVLFLAAVILIAIGVFSYRSELVTLRVTGEDAGSGFSRIGLDLESIPNVNMIADPSFETSSDMCSVEIVSSSSTSLFFEPGALESAGIDYRVTGDQVRVMSIDGSGVMSERFSGIATVYQPARLGAVRQIEDSLDLFASQGVKDAAEFQNLEYILTEEGTLEGDASGMAFVCDLGDEKAEYVAATDKELYVVTASGRIFYTADGRNFDKISIPSDCEDIVRNALFVCAGSEVFAAIDKDGRVLSVKNGYVSAGQIPCGSNEISCFASDGSGFMAVSEDGSLYFSEGGIVFNASGSIEISKDSSSPVKAVCGAGGRFYVLSSDGLIFMYEASDGALTPRILESAKTQGVQITDILASDSGKIIATTAEGSTIVISEDDTLAYFASENVLISDLYCISSDRILFSASGQVYKAKILSELSVDGNIAEDSINSGDFCFITGEILPAQASTGTSEGWTDAGAGKGISGVWDIAGSDTDITCMAREDGNGYCARLTGSATGTHILSQKLPGTSADCFREDAFYRIDINIASEGDTGPVDVWLEGDSFTSQGFTIEEPTGTPQDYSFVFAVTGSMLGDDSVRFNIAFKGIGRLIIDDMPVSMQGTLAFSMQLLISPAPPLGIRRSI